MTNKLTKTKLDAMVKGWLGQGTLPGAPGVPGAPPKLMEFLQGGKTTPSAITPPVSPAPERKKRYPWL